MVLNLWGLWYRSMVTGNFSHAKGQPPYHPPPHPPPDFFMLCISTSNTIHALHAVTCVEKIFFSIFTTTFSIKKRKKVSMLPPYLLFAFLPDKYTRETGDLYTILANKNFAFLYNSYSGYLTSNLIVLRFNFTNVYHHFPGKTFHHLQVLDCHNFCFWVGIHLHKAGYSHSTLPIQTRFHQLHKKWKF